MEYIEAPKNWTRLPGQPAVFLAGGITGCPDWQREIAEKLVMTNYAVLNPRRKDFPINDPSAAENQIRWEFEHLRKADVISFWFCKESIQPIALFELGAWSSLHKLIVIGVEPGYPREQDIYIQMALLGNKRIVSNLDDLASSIETFVKIIERWLRRS
jgi:hypothetical protein